METLTRKLRKRFCKNCNIPISIFEEPYFSKRIKLFDDLYGTNDKLFDFMQMIKDFENEQSFYEYYNHTKEDAINYIKSNKKYDEFITHDMKDINKKLFDLKLPSTDIYKPTNDGKKYLSIDMKQANFNALRTYSETIFGNAKTWEEFIGRFTEYNHIIKSKYIRQVILGNCNPKRQITYEKYLMTKVLDFVSELIPQEDIVSFRNDEIIISDQNDDISNKIKIFVNGHKDLFTIEEFRLKYIGKDLGYIKLYKNGTCKLKCVDTEYLPIFVRNISGKPFSFDDLYFEHKETVARFSNVPADIYNVLNEGELI